MHRFASSPAWGRPGVSINCASPVNTQKFSSHLSRRESSPSFSSFRQVPPASQIFRGQDYAQSSPECFLDGPSSSFSGLTWKNTDQPFLTVAIPNFSINHQHKTPDPVQELDLDALVRDYFENGSTSRTISSENLEEMSTREDSQHYRVLQELFLDAPLLEDEILQAINTIIFSIKDTDLKSFTCSVNCSGGCIRRIIVNNLQVLKFDAEVRLSKWPKFGEYEYIDIILERGTHQVDRLIVDIDFRSQFEIARPTQSYLDLITCLPVVFVGSVEKLSQVLKILAEEAKLSMTQNEMHVPPWRTLAYMTCKWLSALERSHKRMRVTGQGPAGSVGRGNRYTEKCILQLHHLKMCCSSSDSGRRGLYGSSLSTAEERPSPA
ncbi:hypothetical protein KP509_01G087400 [Ceratopteris richardii]|uniref:Uncharacterized protein n=1 Tax=Ceratopteris richardii TaxID=49495 RepID=A0A8T2VMP7_CERRI|nr:hypothetical protein KP509_01G087400 [Ceratopteris richardii]